MYDEDRLELEEEGLQISIFEFRCFFFLNVNWNLLINFSPSPSILFIENHISTKNKILFIRILYRTPFVSLLYPIKRNFSLLS